MKYLLDTNVISEIIKSNCSQKVKSFFEMVEIKNMFLSAFTIGELCFGIERLPACKKKHELSVWLYTMIPLWFKDRIIPHDSEVLIEWGKMQARTVRTLPVDDSLIAATAIVHNMIIVTRNIKDFKDIEGIKLINPWEFSFDEEN